ncbi:hypothetical protein BC939DRAFT_446074 [Gamsiella multidivaricata]|uniref:uncharacterized protein n=1 Tax=Gamsiella multidivaricata TaxID=101098 RepID=UPI00221FD4EF|nr:uncharacterized protein BC939DRAFT_446074 [Gamsiella multidivaricata]KAI7826878.1 hypothetical protein BC939DRAFT_446074 [Gamsiella multidivaricata]
MMSPGQSSPAMFSPPPSATGLGHMSRLMSQGLSPSPAGSVDMGTVQTLANAGRQSRQGSPAMTPVVSRATPVQSHSSLGSPYPTSQPALLPLQQQQMSPQHYQSPSFNPPTVSGVDSIASMNFGQNVRNPSKDHDASSLVGNSNPLLATGEEDDMLTLGAMEDLGSMEMDMMMGDHSYAHDQGYGGDNSDSNDTHLSHRQHDLPQPSDDQEDHNSGLSNLEMQGEEDEDDVMSGFLNL